MVLKDLAGRAALYGMFCMALTACSNHDGRTVSGQLSSRSSVDTSVEPAMASLEIERTPPVEGEPSLTVFAEIEGQATGGVSNARLLAAGTTDEALGLTADGMGVLLALNRLPESRTYTLIWVDDGGSQRTRTFIADGTFPAFPLLPAAPTGPLEGDISVTWDADETALTWRVRLLHVATNALLFERDDLSAPEVSLTPEMRLGPGLYRLEVSAASAPSFGPVRLLSTTSTTFETLD